jgi:CBS domain-containing protein
MRVQEMMSTDVETCRPDDSVKWVAQAMWKRHCGAVPVVDSNGRVHAMITDRDICMAAYEQGRLLAHIKVWSACSHDVQTCQPTDSVEAAEKVMREAHLRRLPVVDGHGTLRGIITLGDIARRTVDGARVNARATTERSVSVASPRASQA